jgi:hypothetical protein
MVSDTSPGTTAPKINNSFVYMARATITLTAARRGATKKTTISDTDDR